MKTVVFEKSKKYTYLKSQYSDFSLIDSYQGDMNPENCMIDFKIHQLNRSDSPCRPIWHYDGTNNPSTDQIGEYCLFLSGDAQSKTKFFVTEPPLFDGTEHQIHQYATQMETQSKTQHIDFDIWHHYTSKNLHSATPSLTAGTRILIRLKRL